PVARHLRGRPDRALVLLGEPSLLTERGSQLPGGKWLSRHQLRLSGPGSSTNTSTARSGSMWLSLKKPTTLRPVSSSTTLLISSRITCCQRRRVSRTDAPSPAAARLRSPLVRLSSSTTKTPFSPRVVFAFVGPL